ncbi:MAG: hypothetical protein AABY93_08140 [Bacteroidota bacterium]
MKTVKIISFVSIVGLVFSLLFSSCENNPEVKPQEDILPKSFRVDIPSSISNKDLANGGRTTGRIKEDSLIGNEIYLNLGTFIAIGEGASEIVEAFIEGIRVYHIDRVLSLTYIGEEDGRTKNLIVVSNSTFEGKTWDYQLTTTDADSENQPDGGKALQIFWNKSSPVAGIAIIKPYNCDRQENANAKDAVFRIDYSEGGDLGYDAQMEVRISGLPLENPLNDPYSISTLRMFVGKKGEVVDVYGNSNHPNAILFSGTVGFNWAFVASGSDVKDVGVAEVGLPPSTLNSSDRKVLLKDYSIKSVFTNEITAVWPGIDPVLLDTYLTNTAAPGYFSEKQGFLSGGTSPGAEWDVLAARLEALSPYNPKETSELVVEFK